MGGYQMKTNRWMCSSRSRHSIVALLSIVLLFGGLPAVTATDAQKAAKPLLEKNVGARAVAMPRSVVWGRSRNKEVVLKLAFKTPVRPTAIEIGRDHPNGTRIAARFAGCAVPLNLGMEPESEVFDDLGELHDDYDIQVGEHDFDADGTPELVVAVGDHSTELHVRVLKYSAPSSPDDACRDENWSIIGSFYGQTKAYVDGSKIELPFGSQGLFQEYKLVGGRFVETN